jgi:hypothetical protein
MKKVFRNILIVLFVVFLTIQFFQPEKNLGVRNTGKDLFSIISVNDSIKILLETSCFDCHSNRTNYPWYGHISPVSVFLNKHVTEGKEKLNFSEWGDYSDKEKISNLVDIYDEVEGGDMPMESYLKIHKNARFSEHEREMIMSWSEKEGLVLLMNKE